MSETKVPHSAVHAANYVADQNGADDAAPKDPKDRKKVRADLPSWVTNG